MWRYTGERERFGPSHTIFWALPHNNPDQSSVQACVCACATAHVFCVFRCSTLYGSVKLFLNRVNCSICSFFLSPLIVIAQIWKEEIFSLFSAIWHTSLWLFNKPTQPRKALNAGKVWLPHEVYSTLAISFKCLYTCLYIFHWACDGCWTFFQSYIIAQQKCHVPSIVFFLGLVGALSRSTQSVTGPNGVQLVAFHVHMALITAGQECGPSPKQTL